MMLLLPQFDAEQAHIDGCEEHFRLFMPQRRKARNVPY